MQGAGVTRTRVGTAFLLSATRWVGTADRLVGTRLRSALAPGRSGLLGIAIAIAVLACCFSPADAAARACGHRRVETKIGPMTLYFQVKGPVRCREARRVVRSYFHQPGSACIGSGCFIHLPSAWNCRAAPAAVTQQQGSVTACGRNHGFERIATSRFPARGFELAALGDRSRR
jgi:hypothetical protein